MKVLALVSGGKDSCYCMAACEKHGHEIVALGNLLPMDEAIDDIDSYMFQTVGHQMVAAYAKCMGLPLFRRGIGGEAVEQHLVYQSTGGDEVEDLFKLVMYVKGVVPGLQAVCSGAIASDYQRLRVENVCQRLGLVSLAYLWRAPQAALFRDMVDYGIHAILVKVAALGLKPHVHLGLSLVEVRYVLFQLREDFGCNVCGEGGEYETLVLDCPLFKHGRVVLDVWEAVVDNPDPISPSGFLRPKAFHVEGKEGAEVGIDPSIIEVTEECLKEVEHLGVLTPADEAIDAGGPSSFDVSVDVRDSTDFCHICCTPSLKERMDGQPPSSDTTSEAMMAMLRALKSEMEHRQLAWRSCIFVHLYLADMSHFGVANQTYCRFFPPVDPPSRACVQLPLPADCPAMMDVLFMSGALGRACDRKILHVQSISRWAPCCIGPYSQCTSLGGLYFMAGQLGLEPALMTRVSGGLLAEFVTALQHCQSVAVAVGGNIQAAMIWATVYLASAGIEHSEGFSSEASSLDWSLQAFNAGMDWWAGSSLVVGHPSDSVQTHAPLGSWDVSEGNSDPEEPLDSYLQTPSVDAQLPPLLIYVKVPALPKMAFVEVQPGGLVLQRQHDNHTDQGISAPDTPHDAAPALDSQAVSPVQVTQSQCFDLPCSFGSLEVASVRVALEDISSDSGVDCRLAWSRSRFLKFHSFIPSLKGKGLDEWTTNQLTSAGQSAAGALCQALKISQLWYEDIAVFRVYYCVGGIGDPRLARDAVLQILQPYLRLSEDGASAAEPVLIPVAGVGLSSSMQSAVALDALVFRPGTLSGD
eukprot:evm.model.scf_296.2 EVM.evm.TU.scf_296.2   scf_296:23669-26092(+)